MLGTALLVGVVIFGYLNISPWVLIPATVVATFIGTHYPKHKAQMAKERGIYWKVILSSLPLQGILMSILFGIGWGVGILVG